MNRHDKFLILVVDDDPNHQVLTRLAFEREAPEARLQTVGSAEEAIALLERAQHSGAKLPDVILLDIRMPGMGGLGFLQWMDKQSAELRKIIVVVFTTSDEPELAGRCRALGAHAFHQKPFDFIQTVHIVRALRPKRSDRPAKSS